jgi:PAS domain S-box-containing protein
LDPRFKKINRILTNYALGNFSKKMKLSNKLDEVDAFISCINMLGEELKETTISKNHFNNIFNSVSDMIFVLDEKGKIQNTSQSVHKILNFDSLYFRNKHIDKLLTKKEIPLFDSLSIKLKKSKLPVELETQFIKSEGQVIPVLCTTVFLFNEKGAKIGYLLVAKDLSNIKHFEFSLKESEEKYRKVFEESSDCIFLADQKLSIVEMNKAGQKLFNIQHAAPISLMSFIQKKEDKRRLLSELKIYKNSANFLTQLSINEGTMVDCLLTINSILNNKNNCVGYRGIIKDISIQKQTEKLVLKTIVDTQEKERKRFAKDIHDSLGQQLSAIKFYIGTSVAATNDEVNKSILTKANNALLHTLAEMRNICFNIMPKTLENYGLVASLNELCNQLEIHEKLAFHLKVNPGFPLLNRELEISIFRIVQEFINNSIKHGKASSIKIHMQKKMNFAEIVLTDNGIGFNVEEGYKKNGMGLTNVRSRIIPYNGDINIISKPGKGVTYIITLPLTKINLA